MTSKSDTIRVVEESKGVEVSGSYEGIPYKGTPIHMKKTDDPADLMKLNRVMHVNRFCLEVDEELAQYEAVCQQLQDGHAQLSFEKIEYIPEKQHWVALVRWIEWWYSPLPLGDKNK